MNLMTRPRIVAPPQGMTRVGRIELAITRLREAHGHLVEAGADHVGVYVQRAIRSAQQAKLKRR